MVIETHGLTKTYGGRGGCRGISLAVPEGQIFGLLGPNGAGKSTLVKTLVGLLRATSGEGAIMGYPLGSMAARQHVGFLPENFRYQDWMTCAEVLEFHAGLHKVPPGERSKQITRAVGLVGLAGRERDRVRTYSKGMQQRLGLAAALVHDPQLVFLDEPTSALDPVGRKEIREAVLALRNEGKTIFLNSHLLSEVELICDQVAIMNKGQVLAAGQLAKLLGDTVQLDVVVGSVTPALLDVLRPLAVKFTTTENRLHLTLRQKEDVPEVARAVASAGVDLLALTPRTRGLEDLFMSLVRGDEQTC